MKHKNIILLGGSGFVGKHLAIELAQRGYHVTVPCRRPHRLNELKVLSSISIVQANIMDKDELKALCKGHDAVFNLVGILNETGKNSFRRIHVDFINSLVQACQQNKIKRLLHMSALGADQASGSSLYLRSKGEGENLIHTFGQNKLEVTSFQPSVIFGSDDSFINRFAGILKLCVGAFPLACPGSRFSPVFIGDVVSAMADKLDDPGSFSKRYPLCGPETWTLQQIVELINRSLQNKCKIIGLPDTLAKFQAMILQNLPGKLFTMDNYRSLQTPSTCKNEVEACPTSLSGYLEGLPDLYSRRPSYDEYRKQLPR
ncbi:MAG: complex I NDUFA9 subunit family protein [Gammaproteobacteria bacterium]|nr:complex I NDUFA9 subunit family protein [Gammaproteobacteria bacterium]